jgi:hypothetical protein
MVAPAVGVAQSQYAVYLSPDNQGRYRPTIEIDGTARVLADIDSITVPALSPDGSTVVFSGALGNGSLARYALHLVGSDGTGLTQLTNGSHAEFDPVWIDGGETIVFAQNVTGSITSNCCRLAKVDVDSGQITVLSQNVGVQRPTATPSGSFIFWDNPSGVWRIPTVGGSATLIGAGGYDATVSAGETSVAYLANSGANAQIRRVPVGGGGSTLLYTTASEIENPMWAGDRIYFIEYDGLGYDGRRAVRLRSIAQSGGNVRTERTFSGRAVEFTPGKDGEEILFYRDDGLFRYYNIRPDGSLPSPLSAGNHYTSGWSSIASVNLDGDADDEMFFYRTDGLFRYYDIRANGSLPGPSTAGSNYTKGWDAITAVDLDGDGQDEMFFYRQDGLFRYYDVRPDGSIPKPMLAGSNYTKGWDAITAVDLDGDGQDEMFFYRDDGLYRFYAVSASGNVGQPISQGNDFEQGLDWISAIDLDGDGTDEILLYRSNGTYAYHDLQANGDLGPVILSGNNYTSGWTIVTSVRLPR